MTSIVAVDELTNKLKQQKLRTQLYVIASLFTIILSIGISWWLVGNFQTTQTTVSEIVQSYRGYANASKLLDDELAKLGEPKPLYEIRDFLPAEENITKLTRQFDQIFADLSTINSPIRNTSLSFGSTEAIDELGIFVLPITLNLESSFENFSQFLNLIETSGLPGSELQFMNVESISLNLQGISQDSQNVLNYTVVLNTYFRTPKE